MSRRLAEESGLRVDSRKRLRPAASAGLLGAAHLGCSSDITHSLVAELLERGEMSTFRVHGTSMHPTIQDGEVITVARLDEGQPSIADIVLFKRGTDLCVHRVARIQRNADGRVTRLLTTGDGLVMADGFCDIEDVMGVVVQVRTARSAWRPRTPLRRVEGRIRSCLTMHPRARSLLRSARRGLQRLRSFPRARGVTPDGGQRAMNLLIADINCSFRGLAGPFADEVLARYAAFRVEDVSQPDLVVDVLVDAGMNAVTPASADDPIVSVERTDSSGDHFRLVREDNPFEAQVDLTEGTASVRLVPNLYCFDSLVRVLYSLLLSRRGGALLHGVSIKFGERAFIAVGQSGAGKTTLARQGFSRVLSDELVAVTRNGSGRSFRAHGTPFWGEFVAGTVQDSASLHAVYLLRKGVTNRVVPISTTRAVLELLGCTFFFGPAECSDDILNLCADLAETKLAGELHFRPTSDVVAYLEGRTLDVIK